MLQRVDVNLCIFYDVLEIINANAGTICGKEFAFFANLPEDSTGGTKMSTHEVLIRTVGEQH